MPGLEDIIGAGDAVKQLFLWQVLGQVLSGALQPYLQSLTEDVNSAHPVVPLAPGDLADAVVRNYMTLGDAQTEAAKSGLDAERFATMVPLHGDAPGAQQLAQALLRGIIPEGGTGPDSDSFEQGIREGRLADKWAPMLRQLAQAVLAPADAADAAVRNFMDPGQAAAEAAKSGVPAELFQVLTHLAGDAPAPGQLAEALRRGLIPDHGTGPDSTSFDQGIAEGRLADKWVDMIRGLAQEWPTPTDALAATLEGQVTEDDGKALFAKFGGDPQYFQLLYNTRGNAPTPVEALELANRGIIPWEGTGPDAVSYHQAFLEGPWRNKWLEPYKALGNYIPPPETVRTLLEQGAITQDQAATFWKQNGMDDATVQAYLQAALFNNLADTRGLTINAILDMYYGQLIGKDDATQFLDLFQVPAANVDLLLAYVDMRRSVAAVQASVDRIQTLFTSRKIGTDTASAALERLQIPADAIDSIISIWEITASVNVKTLTEAQIVDAYGTGIMDQGAAMTELAAIGYTDYDAWVLLSIKAKGPLPDQPPQLSAAPIGDVIPGVT